MALKRKITKDEHGKLAKDLQAHYEADGDDFILKTEGDEDVGGLKTSLAKERDNVKEFKKQLKEVKDQLAEFEGIDLVTVKELMAKFENDDEGKLIKAGKLDEVITRRTEKLRAEYDKKLKAETEKVEAEKARVARYQQRVLDNAVRQAAAKAGLHAVAVEDALGRARAIFTLDDQDNAIQLDDTKHPKIGKDGKTPFGPGEWLEGMKETAPHWFPVNGSGAGALGDKGGHGGKKVYKRADFEKLPPQEQVAAARDARDGKAVIVDA